MDSSLSRVWWALALRGLLGVLFGVAALLWPGATLAAIMLLFGLFAIAEGVFTLAALLAGWAVAALPGEGQGRYIRPRSWGKRLRAGRSRGQ